MAKTLKIIKGVGAVVLVVSSLLYLTGNQYIFKALNSTYLQGHTTANIDDGTEFAQRKIAAGLPQTWKKDPRYNQAPISVALAQEFKSHKTSAYLVAQDGKLLQEYYFDGYSPLSRTNSFSMAKTVTTLLIGAAIDDGFIKSFNEPIVDFLPEYENNPRARKATIAQLSAMSAGHDWDEEYFFPIHPMPHLYYGKDASQVVLGRDFEREPGTAFEYSSASTQLLGIILDRALKRRDPNATVSQYLSDKIWKPLGMEGDAYFTLDREQGIEKTYCCLFTSAHNFAKIGQLLLQNGQWQGRQLFKPEFIKEMITPDLEPFYGHSLWMDYQYKHPFYFLYGFLGQYTIIVPSKNLVIVRLGRDQTFLDNPYEIPPEVYTFVDEAVSASQLTSHAILGQQRSMLQ